MKVSLQVNSICIVQKTVSEVSDRKNRAETADNHFLSKGAELKINASYVVSQWNSGSSYLWTDKRPEVGNKPQRLFAF